jgi:hypothetical protein
LWIPATILIFKFNLSHTFTVTLQKMESKTAQGVKRRTSLQLAAERGNTGLVESLIPSHTDLEISRAISTALTRKHTLTAKRLVEGMKSPRDHRKHILKAAILAENLVFICFLDDKGIYADEEMLILAVNRGNKELLKLLIETCVDFEINGMRAASAALEMGDRRSAKTLFVKGALVDQATLMRRQCGEKAEKLMLKHATEEQKAKFRKDTQGKAHKHRLDTESLFGYLRRISVL